MWMEVYYKMKEESTERRIRVWKKKADILDNMPLCPDHRDKVRGRPCLMCEIEKLQSKYNSLMWVLKRIVEDLPRNKDWLDPHIEDMARYIVAESKFDGEDLPDKRK